MIKIEGKGNISAEIVREILKQKKEKNIKNSGEKIIKTKLGLL